MKIKKTDVQRIYCQQLQDFFGAHIVEGILYHPDIDELDDSEIPFLFGIYMRALEKNHSKLFEIISKIYDDVEYESPTSST